MKQISLSQTVLISGGNFENKSFAVLMLDFLAVIAQSITPDALSAVAYTENQNISLNNQHQHCTVAHECTHTLQQS